MKVEENQTELPTSSIELKNKLDYWATGGTLLGTVRSKGMIQWDDDIDVAIIEMARNLYPSL